MIYDNLKKCITILFYSLYVMHTYAQTFLQKQKMAQAVFENVVNAYGNAKAAPLLIILPKYTDAR